MNITFVHNALESIGIEYLSASLKYSGHNISLVFDPSIAGTFRFFNKTLAHLLSYEELIIEKIIKTKPALVCFSVYSDNYPWACRIAQKLKQKIKVPVIFGGVHPTLVPEKVIMQPFVDYACVGEGEIAIVKLVDQLISGNDKTDIENIWSKQKDKIISPKIIRFIDDLDTLASPDKDLFYNEFPLFVKDVYTIVTSRCCIFKCTYCHNSYLKTLYKDKRYKHRRRSVKNVINELLCAKVKYRIRRVLFFDDLFISQPGWLQDFLEEYKKKINLPFFCTVHTHFLNKDIVDLLEKADCSAVNMGIQTISEKIRRNILHRYETNYEIIKAIKLFKGTKIFLFTNVIFGLPEQDEKEMIEIVRFFNEFRPDFPDSNWLRYYPKTQIIEIAQKKSLLDKDEIEKINNGEEFRPYSLGGHTRNNLNSKLRNLLSISHFLPRSVIDAIIKYKVYNYFPTFNLRESAVMLTILYKKVFENKKNPYPHFTLMEIVKFHCYYIFLKYSKQQRIKSIL